MISRLLLICRSKQSQHNKKHYFGRPDREMIANLLQMSPIDQREVFFEVCHSVPSEVNDFDGFPFEEY